MKITKGPKKFKVWRDTSEHEGYGWIFPCIDRCLGTDKKNMYTADYTIEGYEDKLLIERKGSTSELVTNLNEKRFHDELYRMDKVDHPYLVLEFLFENIVAFPAKSSIPRHLWSKIKMRGPNFIKSMHELQLAHPKLRIVYVGQEGKQFILSLFKRIVDLYGTSKKI